MDKQDKDRGSSDSQTGVPAVRPKKPYRAPDLVRYGNLRDLSLGADGSKSDGAGAPKSRA